MKKKWTDKEINCILQLSSLINSSLDIVEVLDNSMRAVEELVSAEASSIFEIDFEKNELFFRLARGESGKKVRQVRMKMGEGIAGWVASSGEPLIIANAQDDMRFCNKVDEISCFRTKSVLAVPLRYKENITGVIEVLNKRMPGSFDERDREVLTIAANQIAIAMENAKLYARMKEKFMLTRSELKESQEKLIRSERLAALGKLSQGIAHAVRNPVMSIGGFARRLKKRAHGDADIAEYVDMIAEETARLERMVKDVWTYTSMPQPKPQQVRLSALIQRVLQDWKRGKKDLEIDIDLDRVPEDPVICIDIELMNKALGSALLNAQEAIAGGGTIVLSAQWEDRWLTISVRDSGSGIAAKDLPYVFDPFFTTKTHGSGLGLTMVQRIVTEHRGEVKICSEQGVGTEVKLCFPPFSGDRT